MKYYFPLNFVIFLNSASSAAALVFYLPGVSTHTDTEGKQRKARVRNTLKSKKTQYLMNTLYVFQPARLKKLDNLFQTPSPVKLL